MIKGQGRWGEGERDAEQKAGVHEQRVLARPPWPQGAKLRLDVLDEFPGDALLVVVGRGHHLKQLDNLQFDKVFV